MGFYNLQFQAIIIFADLQDIFSYLIIVMYRVYKK